jgi:hypothetical protein
MSEPVQRSSQTGAHVSEFAAPRPRSKRSLRGDAVFGTTLTTGPSARCPVLTGWCSKKRVAAWRASSANSDTAWVPSQHMSGHVRAWRGTTRRREHRPQAAQRGYVSPNYSHRAVQSGSSPTDTKDPRRPLLQRGYLVSKPPFLTDVLMDGHRAWWGNCHYYKKITHVSVNRPPTATTQRATVLMTFDRDLYRHCRHNGTSIGAYLSAPRKRPALFRFQNGETVTSGAPSFTTDRDRNEAKETFGARRRGLVARRPPPKRHGRHCNRHSYQYLSSGRAL